MRRSLGARKDLRGDESAVEAYGHDPLERSGISQTFLCCFESVTKSGCIGNDVTSSRSCVHQQGNAGIEFICSMSWARVGIV